MYASILSLYSLSLSLSFQLFLIALVIDARSCPCGAMCACDVYSTIMSPGEPVPFHKIDATARGTGRNGLWSPMDKTRARIRTRDSFLHSLCLGVRHLSQTLKIYIIYIYMSRDP
ncbi:hypothetical protein B0F90DRAFT_1760874 [Multifurca ochricompacta]|uniref:Secreted protein n=1 Tax=Multifurca ochricompacta TaxID=376703 RepID=A0AAD4LYT2_9AGAM|nr:hypothetical protein B0F90DRAFT_1760874 [Multifurca ochricompacta]